MVVPHRLIIIASSVFLLVFIAVFLATSIESRAPSQNIFKVIIPQALSKGEVGRVVGGKARIDGTAFDRGDVWHATSLLAPNIPIPSTTIATGEGAVEATPIPHLSVNWSAEGVIGPLAMSLPTPVAHPSPITGPRVPIVALSYSSSGGPKHCRGELLYQHAFPPPLEKWKNGTCINLPGEARCGVFFSSTGDNCEAQLFNMRDCYNTTRTYVNTVVFMPEDRPVGALWSSMWVRCGVEVPEAKILDPSILGGALKKIPSGG